MGSQGRKRPGRKQDGLERQLGTLTPTGFFFLIPPPPHTPTSRQNRRYGQNPRTAPALRRLLNRGCLRGRRLGLGRSWLPCAGAGNRRAEGQRQPPRTRKPVLGRSGALSASQRGGLSRGPTPDSPSSVSPPPLRLSRRGNGLSGLGRGGGGGEENQRLALRLGFGRPRFRIPSH